MLTETLILASSRTPTDSIDAPSISVYDLHTSIAQYTYKRTHTSPRGLAVTCMHLFTAQSDKSVINIHPLSPSARLESSIPFPDRITALAASPCSSLLALGTSSGRLYLWELASARLVATPQTHLQPVTCLTFTAGSHLVISGGDDATVNVWSASTLLDVREPPRTPIHTLSRHTRQVTAVAAGRSSAGPLDVVFSASLDASVIAWNPYLGTALRTYILTSPARCLALDPADRAVYAGLENGGVQAIDLHAPGDATSGLYPSSYWDVPVTLPPAATGGPAAVISVAVSYEGNLVVAGDQAGEVTVRDAETGKTMRVVTNMKAPVTGIVITGPFKEEGAEVAVVPRPRYDAILAATSSRTYNPGGYNLQLSWNDAPKGGMGPEKDMEAIREGARRMEGIGGEKVKVERVQRLEGELERLYAAYERLSEVHKRTWEALVESKTRGGE